MKHGSMSLRRSYTLWAPLYDTIVDRATRGLRRASLADLPATPDTNVLLPGVGTGLDLPLLPPGPRYTGIDLTPAMLARARRRAATLDLDISLEVADAMALPHGDAVFDAVVLHLVTAVVPAPERVLSEAARVVRPGGTIHVVDKFLLPGQRAPVRRAISPLLGRLATRTDVVFEDVLARVPGLTVRADRPGAFGGWFRLIQLERTTPAD